MTAPGFPRPSNLRGEGNFRGPAERHVRALQNAAKAVENAVQAVENAVQAVESGTSPVVDAFNAPGYLYGGTIYYTSSGTFSKGDYPGLRAVMVECQGKGGNGGGITANTAAGQVAISSGGSGGDYARSFILESDLASSEAVTVGTDSVFDTISGEVRGRAGSNAGSGSVSGSALAGFSNPTQPNSSASVGDLVVKGGAGGGGIATAANRVHPGRGGDSFLGRGGAANVASTTQNGQGGSGFGGGGSGAALGESQSTNVSGGSGAPGIVIVHLFY